MAESLAAVGLAGNIVQFISFSAELVSKTRDIHKSGLGVSGDVVDLDSVSNSLRSLIRPILNQGNVSTQLQQIAERCHDVADELLEATAELKYDSNLSNKGPTKWQSFRKALKCIWKKDQIDALKMRLQLLRDQLSLHLVSNTNKNQTHVLHLLENWKRYMLRAEHTMTTQISDLDTKLRSIQQDTTCAFNDDDRAKLHDMCTKVRVEVQQLSRHDAIIRSLSYECMEVRYEAIKDAHKKTFDWMFDPVNSQMTNSQPASAFSSWLESGSGIYWVTGKPGSGKSTLMKYLFKHEESTKRLQAWAGATPLVQASFYFWIPGQTMQKSLKGLLQTLLYHILSNCPELVPILCAERSGEQYTEQVPQRRWTLPELQKAFQIFRLRKVVTAKFYLHIDGLDEYYGDSWDVIHTLQDLATCPNVKMCLSSRPWNSFQDAFGRSNPHVLQLHEWTKKDIKIFASESLMAYAAHSDFETSLFNDLIQDIADRAQGVFLWVRLVVHSLRDGITNDDPVSILHERLRVIPTDLEDFFQHILESVEDVYRPRMARTFLAALQTQEPLKTVHYHFLDQDDSVFDLDSLSAPWSKSKMQQVVQQTHRRLNGRFRGLLEPSNTKALAKHPTVDFLHRTLRDFLKTERMIKWLKTRASPESSVLLAMGRALLATQSAINPNFIVDDLDMIKVVIELASLAYKETGHAEQCHAVVDLAHDIYQRANKDHLHAKCGVNCYIVHFAIAVGHTDYLRHRIQSDARKVDINRILKHALCCPLRRDDTFSPCLPETLTFRTPQAPQGYELEQYPTKHFGHDLSPRMIATLLDLGADPNAVVDSTSSWTLALREVVAQMDSARNASCLPVIELFLEKCDYLDSSHFKWDSMFSRQGGLSDEGMRSTKRFLNLLFSHGTISPNFVSQGTTLFSKFLRTLPSTSSRLLSGLNTEQQYQHQILLTFLRLGADITQVYKVDSSEAWFPSFLRGLSTRFLDETKITEYQIFLEHSLHPNAVLRGNITIWYSILGVIHKCTQQDHQAEAQHRAIYRIMLSSIQHGADPYAPGLPRVLQWMKSRLCHLTAREVTNIEEALPSSRLITAGVNAVERKRKGDDDDQIPSSVIRAKKGKR